MPLEAHNTTSFQSMLLKSAVYQKYVLCLFCFSCLPKKQLGQFFIYGDFSLVGCGTLPTNNYKLFQDL